MKKLTLIFAIVLTASIFAQGAQKSTVLTLKNTVVASADDFPGNSGPGTRPPKPGGGNGLI